MSGAGRPVLATVDAAGLTLAIVGTRWHAEVTDRLVDRARAAAAACGIAEPLVVRVAGAVELPVVAAELARRYDAVTCVGAVVRGGTPHFDYVCDALTVGLGRAALDAGTPVGNGVLTCDTMEQARARCGPARHSDRPRNGTGPADVDGSTDVDEGTGADGREDKGWDAVVAALDAALVLRSIRARAVCASTH